MSAINREQVVEAINSLIAAVNANPIEYQAVWDACEEARSALVVDDNNPRGQGGAIEQSDLSADMKEQLHLLLERIFHPGPDWFAGSPSAARAMLRRCQVSLGEAKPNSAMKAIYLIANGCYELTDGSPFTVNDNEDYVLQAFRDCPALNLADLTKRSGVDQPNRILKRLHAKLGDDYIMMPQGKSKGGYRVNLQVKAKVK